MIQPRDVLAVCSALVIALIIGAMCYAFTAPYRGMVAGECWPYRDYEICRMVTPTP